jgi:hypothetical protein
MAPFSQDVEPPANPGRFIAFPAEYDGGMLPATAGQTEMIEQVVEGLAADGDVQVVAGREIRQALPTDLVVLREENLLLTAMQGSPAGDPAFQGPPQLVGNGVLAELVLDRLEDRDGNNAVDLEQLLHARPERLKRVGTGAPVALAPLLGGKAWIVLESACATFADTGLDGRDSLGVMATFGHEEKHLLIGKVVTRHRNPSLLCSMSGAIPPLATALISPFMKGE